MPSNRRDLRAVLQPTGAVIVGLGSFVLIRRPDIASKAIIGIVVRSLIGIGVGLCACVVLWLYVGHRVIGF